MTFHLGIVLIVLAITLPILSGALYGLLLRLGYDPLGITGGSINTADEPLKAAVDMKHERKANRDGEADE